VRPRLTTRCLASDRRRRVSAACASAPGVRLGSRCPRRRQDSATLSAVNYAEVVQKAAQHGFAAENVDSALEALGITVSPFGRLDARLAASFYRHRSNLSLGDRVCLALARSLSSPAFTADRAWQRWAEELGVDVRVIR
jgi:PIN domain nuclease of toxin-antitoxin system